MKAETAQSRRVRTRRTAKFRVTEVFYPALLRQPRHRHDGPSLSFVSSGRYEERYGDRIQDRQAATLVLHPPGEAHAVEFLSDVRILSVDFDPADWVRLVFPDSRDSFRGQLIAWLGARLDREMARTDAASALAIEGIVCELLAECSRGKTTRKEKGFPEWLPRAKALIHDSFADTFSLAEVARLAEVHPAHLSRVFRQTMGCTIGEYVRRLRLEYACGQIFNTDTRLCDIALDAGFADQSHFNRAFRAQMGVTPYAYRRLLRPDNSLF